MNVLEEIILNHPDDMPATWQTQPAEMEFFSHGKSLYGFQKLALDATVKGLWLHYRDPSNPGQYLEGLYRAAGAGKVVEQGGVNRMGLWMATGSGKTLVIVKVIELLGTLIQKGELPVHDLLFLVYRDNLLEQFMRHVEEYNAAHPQAMINLVDLQDYERAKQDGIMAFASRGINVFYYRADLFFEKRTAKKIDPNSVDNNGNWFLLLDEAHRGDSDDSALQQVYTRLSRNGFLFNFSATFIDEIDRVTCAYNFNLQKFIGEGYGKQIYVSQENIQGFGAADDFSEVEKQRIVLKSLILQTYIKSRLKKIRQHSAPLYHNPLLLTIVNKVTDSESDLRLFFSELEKIAGGRIRLGLFAAAKEELIAEMQEARYLFMDEKLKIDRQDLDGITYDEVLRSVFNTQTQGQIEVLRIPGNQQELVFKMQTSSVPFALIRIGDVTNWVKEILQGYLMVERYDDASVFQGISDDNSPINILMGSRTFYEGWDSNRPNIILFVNMGVGKDSRKFVLQAAGRGVRIEPIENRRMRLQNLHTAHLLGDPGLYNKVKDDAAALETLFIYGTNAENLSSVIRSLRAEGKGKVFDLGMELAVNPDANRNLLLVPAYESTETPLSDTQGKFPISQPDLDTVRNFLGHLGDKVLLMKFTCTPEILEKTRQQVATMASYQEKRVIGNPEVIANRLLDYFSVKNEELGGFGKLGEHHIVHFRKIQFSGSVEEYETLKQRTKVIVKYPIKAQQKELARLFAAGDQKAYDKQKDLFDAANDFSIDNRMVHIKHLANHYYHPLLVANDDKVEYLAHIIRVSSEVEFVKTLEDNIHAFSDFDWWMFSKLDETLDDVFIPYYNYGRNRLARFCPDFIFWMQKGQDYRILFVDPKGVQHSQYQHKADGYSKLFGGVGKETRFPQAEHGGINVEVHLRFFGGDKAQVGEGYRDYWADSIEELLR